MAAREGERAAVDLRLGDCLDVLRTMADASVDAIVTDPPSGISFMSAKWDSDKGGRDQWVAWLAAIMREAKRVIRPGGHALIWALPRTSHWTATAVEDAGWAVRDICHHINGQAFPKSLNLGEGRGSGLKPSTEHWILARAPLSERTIAANVQRWGTGGINIDASRIGTTRDVPGGMSTRKTASIYGTFAKGGSAEQFNPNMGRWPANLILSCCGDDPHREGCPVAELDAQSGYSISPTHTGRGAGGQHGRLHPIAAQGRVDAPGDSGGASRYFYVAKPSRAERDRGLEHLPRTSAADMVDRTEGSAGMQSPRAGAGRTGGGHNHHPTVKPIALMKHLVGLITPPGGTVLDMFCGSGTTGCACAALGFDFIGIEQDQSYIDIAALRIQAATPTQPALQEAI